MIEQAFISGQLGKAIYEDGGRFFVIDTDQAEPVECQPMDFSAFFNFGSEVSSPKSRIDLQSLHAQLQTQTRIHHALRLLISGMDEELDRETRVDVIREAEKLITDEQTHAFVHSRLLSSPLPIEADITTAVELAIESNSRLASKVYQTIIESDEYIELVRKTWNETAVEYFSSFEAQATATQELIDLGAFAHITSIVVAGNLNVLNSLVVTYAKKAELPGVMRPGSVLLNDFKSRLVAKLDALLSPGKKKSRRQIKSEREDPEEDRNSIETMLARFKNRREQPKPKMFKADEAKERVDRQISEISRLISQGNFNLANRYLKDLIGFQVKHSEREHLAMSLCSLAKIAIDAQAFELAESMVNYALMLGIDDPVIPNTKAELLKATGDFDRALDIYEQTMTRFPSDEVARGGYAEVLKATGEFDRALEVYKDTMDRFPNNEVVRNGYAEVLKATGEFDRALEVYEETMARFPNNEVVRNGYAEVLKATGEFDRALQVYEETMARFPTNEVARSGYAEVLKATGEFDRALEVYEETVARFPNNGVVRSGYAEVLKATGEFDRSLKVYEETMARFPNDEVARNGYAEVLKATGEFDRALKVYEETMARFPNNVIACSGYAEVLKATGEFDRALKVYEETMARFPNNEVARNGYAEVLKATGEFDRALEVYKETMARFPNDEVVRNAYAETLKATGEFDRALKVYEETMARFPHNEVARSGYAEVLKAMGKLDQACLIYRDGLNRHKYNRVLRNGYASVLVLMNKFQEARRFLSVSNPRSKDDWIAYHIIAMSYLKEGNLDQAVERFTTGLEKAPYAQRAHFATALAVTRIRQKEFEAVIELLPIQVPQLDILQKETRLALVGHSKAALGQKDEALQLISRLEKTRNPRVISLRDAMSRRYGLGKHFGVPISKSEADSLDISIFDQEYFLVAEAA